MEDRVTLSWAGGKPKSLLHEIRAVIRFKHYCLRTEEAYVDWIKRFLRFHPGRHPREMGAGEVTAFLLIWP
jgi:hypothetical protein